MDRQADSPFLLQHLRNETQRFKTHVVNRTAETLEGSSVA